MKPVSFIALIFLLSNFTMNSQLKEVNYADGTQKLTGMVVKPKTDAKKKAGVLILPAWMGITAHTKRVAEQLGEMGYYAFAADIYGEGHHPKDAKEAGQQAGYYKSHVDEYRKRIKLALDELIKQGADPQKIVVIGYCFGGTGALEAARANFPVKGVVSFHGGLARDTAKTIEAIVPKVLVCHGAIDPYVPEAQVRVFQKEMSDSKADWQMIYYANAVHAFTEKEAGDDNSKGAAYNANADKRSWEAMKQFLKEMFGE
jgi:dienelactone hydrolase